jgi:hypothetical protein
MRKDDTAVDLSALRGAAGMDAAQRMRSMNSLEQSRQ